MSPSNDETLVREQLARARKVLVITGAGVSAESGVPTFRGAGGVWNQVNPQKVATPEGFAADPVAVWRWYDERRVALLGCKPNPGHVALAALERRMPEFLLATQNVDHLHEAAGSRQMEHIHGSIWRVRCSREDCPHGGRETLDQRAPLPELPPRCACGALLRPAVVWFGELLPMPPLERIDDFLRDGIDMLLLVGTTAMFPYIVQWVRHAVAQGAMLVEINPERGELTRLANVYLAGKSGEVLPRLV